MCVIYLSKIKVDIVYGVDNLDTGFNKTKFNKWLLMLLILISVFYSQTKKSIPIYNSIQKSIKINVIF